MKWLICTAALFCLFGLSFGNEQREDQIRCQCCLRIRGLIFPSDPIYIHDEQPIMTCDAEGHVTCQTFCAVWYKEFANGSIDWEEEREDNRTWGQYFCDETRLELEIADGECVDATLEPAYRIMNCDEDWRYVTDEPEIRYCCNQKGSWVKGCPLEDVRRQRHKR